MKFFLRGAGIFIIFLIVGCATNQRNIKTISATKIFPEKKAQRMQGFYHKVKKGENLYRISQLYGVELSELIRINRITDPSVIKEGQLIYIPENKGNFVAEEKDFIWPLKGKIVSSFGSLTKKGKNKGIDIKAKGDNNIKAVKSGVVCYAGEEIKGYGKVIILNHGNDLYTLYAYNDRLFVKKGDRVKQGEVIALVNKSKPILHFEIRKGHKALNPVDFLK